MTKNDELNRKRFEQYNKRKNGIHNKFNGIFAKYYENYRNKRIFS